MKTVNINASTNSKRIPIGRCEDNEATRVVFDCSVFSSAYGSGQATLLHRRSKEKISYIVQNITQEDDTVTWTVSSDDTAFSGEGTLQLMWTVNDVVVHSHFYTTITDPSLTDSSSEPTEVKSALQLLIDSCYTKEETDDLIAHMRAGSDWNAGEGEDGYIANKPSIPSKTSELTNDSDYQTGDDVANAINTAITSVMHYKGTVATVLSLPASDNTVGDVYHVTEKSSEYAWDGSKWEELGTEMDLSSYATKTWVEDKGYLTSHQDISGKADKTTTYTKTEVDTALSAKAGTAVATTSANGLMSSTDKNRLDELYADYSSALTALGVN